MGVPKERKCVRVACVSGDISIKPFVNDFQTLQRAVVERVFCVKDKNSSTGFGAPPKPGKGIFAETLCGVKASLVPLLPSTAPVSHKLFVESYEGRKKQRYERALEEIQAGRANPKKDAEVKCFVKFEKTDHSTKKDPVPRVISPRDPKFNVKVGRYLKHLEKPLFKSLDLLFGHKTILKGLNAELTAQILREKWDSYRTPVAIGLDASRFDQHVSLDALDWEHSIYLHCFPEKKHRSRLAALLSHQRLNKCYGETPDGELSYQIEGTRMSGDMNTSMGNCLIMSCMVKGLFDHLGIQASLANNGDDCVVFMEKSDLHLFASAVKNWFHRLGFNMTVEEPVYDFEALEFCQTHPVFDGETYVMCRNPWTAICKDSVMLQPWQGPRQFRGWLDAVGTGGLALASRLPIFQSLYLCYQRSGMKRKVSQDLLPWSFRQLGKGLTRAPGVVQPEARASFYLAFGVTPDEQVALERYYDGLSLGASLVSYAPRPVFRDSL